LICSHSPNERPQAADIGLMGREKAKIGSQWGGSADKLKWESISVFGSCKLLPASQSE
jgi:hypothetical protein